MGGGGPARGENALEGFSAWPPLPDPPGPRAQRRILELKPWPPTGTGAPATVSGGKRRKPAGVRPAAPGLPHSLPGRWWPGVKEGTCRLRRGKEGEGLLLPSSSSSSSSSICRVVVGHTWLTCSPKQPSAMWPRGTPGVGGLGGSARRTSAPWCDNAKRPAWPAPLTVDASPSLCPLLESVHLGRDSPDPWARRMTSDLLKDAGQRRSAGTWGARCGMEGRFGVGPGCWVCDFF